MLVKTYGSAVYGMSARTITIEVNVSPELHYFMVGLPDSAVKESLRRIESAIRNNHLPMPRTKLVVNLAPAHLRKSGTAFDLPIAMGVLGASEQLDHPDRLEDYMIMGELSLDGTVRPITGVLAMAEQACSAGFKGLIVPWENASEASLSGNLPVYGVRQLRDVIDLLVHPDQWQGKERPKITAPAILSENRSGIDVALLKGQEHAKRGFEIAAAGSHNVLLIGPPGAGKTLLARSLPTILPRLTMAEAIETTKILSMAGKLPPGVSLINDRPFRSPHHTISDVALVGGGFHPQPGEISLAHNGVLFLDELPEFSKRVLEVLRQPLEERCVTISRSAETLSFPARFMLVSAMNPCPCGYHTHPDRACLCTTHQIRRYLGKVSGPLLDRIDLQIEVNPVSFSELDGKVRGESSAAVRARVSAARIIQTARFGDKGGIYGNAHMEPAFVAQFCRLPPGGQALLRTAMERFHLSARAYDRICKVARTIADLEPSPNIRMEPIAEALLYRSLDREGWAA